MIVAFIGYAESGKDVAASFLVERGWKLFVFSDVLVAEVLRRGLLDTRSNRAIVGASLREESGDRGIVARMLSARMKKSCSHTIVLSGMRSPEELTILREEYGFVLPVYISCPLELRYVRRRDPLITMQEIAARDSHNEKTMGLGELIGNKMYERRIENTGTLEELKIAVLDLVKDFE